MRSTLRQFNSITLLTALEASRQPIFLLLTTVVILFIGMLPLLITHVIGDADRVIRDSALAVQLVSGLVLGCYAATSTITRELHQGTLASILSKPVGRTLFFLAKYAGVALIMMIFATTTTMATMLSVRTVAETHVLDWWGIAPIFVAVVLAYLWAGLQNFFMRTPFVSRTYLLVAIAVTGAFLVSCLVPSHDETPGFASAIPWNIAPAGLLLGMAMVLLSAFAVSLATRMDLVPTLTLCFTVFLLGLMSDYLFGRQSDVHWIYALIHGIVPNWQHFWAVDALKGDGIPWRYTGGVALYVFLYSAVVLSGGLYFFKRMEVK